MLMSWKELDNLIAKVDVNAHVLEKLHNIMAKADASCHILRKAFYLNLRKAFDLNRCSTWYQFSDDIGDIGKRPSSYNGLLSSSDI